MREKVREMVDKFPSVEKVYDAIAGARRLGSEITVEKYVEAIDYFVRFLGFDNPEKAVEALLNQKVNAKEKIDAFIDFALEKMGRSHASVRGMIFGVKKWFDLNGVSVNWKKIEMPTSNMIREQDRAPTKDDLKKLLNHANSSRDRAIIFVLSSSGLRIGTLLSLRIGDVSFNYPDVASITVESQSGRKFQSKRGRNAGRMFVTFITPEAKEALQQYLTERKLKGEQVSLD